MMPANKRSPKLPTESRRAQQPLRVLFAASEVFPFIKTGGLADAAGFLPPALHRQGVDVRILLPGYQSVLNQDRPFKPAGGKELADLNVRLLQTSLPGSEVSVWLVDAPDTFSRNGGPYQDARGQDWSDNAQRFALFARVITQISMDRAGLDWKPDIVHCNDWHTGLAPALLKPEQGRPATVFSIHNLAYQGLFPFATFDQLGLPASLRTPAALEFYGQLSFIKGGLVFADELITVSPTYAREITTPAQGMGLDGLLRDRQDHLTGILNGVDYDCWDPVDDPLIPVPYDVQTVPKGKQKNKTGMQKDNGLEADPDALLMVQIGRLTEQKGIDLTLSILPSLLNAENRQLIVLGKGDAEHEDALHKAAHQYPGRMAVITDHDEKIAHRLLAAADLLLMPSRFEPCGLTQLYGFRYGTLPVVYSTGGLVDTVIDADDEQLKKGSATGFHFRHYHEADYLAAIDRATILFKSNSPYWQQMLGTAMRQQFSWDEAAHANLEVYRRALAARPKQAL